MRVGTAAQTAPIISLPVSSPLGCCAVTFPRSPALGPAILWEKIKTVFMSAVVAALGCSGFTFRSPFYSGSRDATKPDFRRECTHIHTHTTRMYTQYVWCVCVSVYIDTKPATFVPHPLSPRVTQRAEKEGRADRDSEVSRTTTELHGWVQKEILSNPPALECLIPGYLLPKGL